MHVGRRPTLLGLGNLTPFYARPRSFVKIVRKVSQDSEDSRELRDFVLKHTLAEAVDPKFGGMGHGHDGHDAGLDRVGGVSPHFPGAVRALSRPILARRFMVLSIELGGLRGGRDI